MSFEHLGSPQFESSDQLQIVRHLFKPEGQLGDRQIFIREMTINEEPTDQGITHGEDIARIRVREDTPIQRYDGTGVITEVMYDSFSIENDIRMPIGIILMSPEGDIKEYIYDPRTDGGPRSYQITKGWRMQTIVPDGIELQFYDHWSKGFCNPGDIQRYHGYEVLPDEDDPEILEKFKESRERLLEYLEEISG